MDCAGGGDSKSLTVVRISDLYVIEIVLKMEEDDYQNKN